MRDPLLLHFDQKRTSTGTRRLVTLESGPAESAIEIFYDIEDAFDLPEPVVLDGFVQACLYYAMGRGRNIRVRGPMSWESLRYIRELQEARVAWRPQNMKKIDIEPDDLVYCQIKEGAAIAAFSGGVDSIFTALRHAKVSGVPIRFPLDHSLMMVHGFDVPLERFDQFAALKKRVQPLVEELGLDIHVIATNSKALEPQKWGTGFAAQLSACLHNFSHSHSFGLIGSGVPHTALGQELGSSPALDHLLSGGMMRIVHDGAGYTRSGKVAQIAKNKTARSVLKVCWEGKDTSKNCGMCEKCVRTKLNFLSQGAALPSSLPNHPRWYHIAFMKNRNKNQTNELKSILRARTAEGPWVIWTRVAIALYPLKRMAWHILRVFRRVR